MSTAQRDVRNQGPGYPGRRQRSSTAANLGPNYKWIALSNTTLGMLIATINSSIVLIALPDIFKGIGVDPLDSGNTSYLLWMMMGFLVVTAVLVVSFGRLGDMYGRAKMYNLGFAIFTISSIFLAVTWMNGSPAALWLIGWRIVQGIGGAFLMANSSAILTDAFPANQRGLAMGINGVAAIAGSFLGLVVGGVLSPVNWHLIFLVSVPVGVFGTIWAYIKLHDLGIRQHAKMDWWGNITFAVGLIAVLVAITYGIQPYGGSSMGWGNPWVLAALGGGIVLLLVFGVVETKVANPLFNLSLFRIRSFSAGNVANLMAALGRGGLQFILIIWLQGIWLPQHGYSFASTPLWAGIYMLPMTVGFLLSAPLSGVLSDRVGTRAFAAVGMLVTALTFGALIVLPVNFNYVAFAAILLVNGIGMGMFAAPNRAQVMNSLPGSSRGVGAGMTATFQNAAMVLSIGIFFSLIIAGLSAHLPTAMSQGLIAHGVPNQAADQVANLPAVAVLFAAFLGYNPIQQLLGPVLGHLPADQASFLTGRSFFPSLISAPFEDGLMIAFWFAIGACLIGAIASMLSGSLRTHLVTDETVGAELAAVAGGAGSTPAELVTEVPSAGLNGNGHSAAGPADGFALDGAGLVGNGAHANGANGHGPPPALGHGTVLAGAVLGPGGVPVDRAVVTVTDREGRQADRVLVHQDGRYEMSGLRPGAYTVIASAPGLDPQAVAASMVVRQLVRRDFLLTGGGSIAGLVASLRGLPLAEATVTAVTAQGRVAATALTDDTGRYLLAGLPDGEYTVVASLFAPSADQVHIGAGQSVHLDVTLGAGEPRSAALG